MSFKNELVEELEVMEANVSATIKLVENAFSKLEIEAENFQVKRRGIVKTGANYIMKLLQEREKASFFLIKVVRQFYFVLN